MAYYLGIDGGGTKTRFALADETTILARATCGGSNMVRLGETQAAEVLRQGVQQVCASARISPEEIQAACIGTAGSARPEIAAKIRTIFSGLGVANFEVVGDSVVALEAAFGAGPGMIAIAGTGSIVYGRDAQGNLARAGGWGFAISDEGSGHWIGRRAVSVMLEAHDGGIETTLPQLAMECWRLRSMDELVQFANSTPPPDFPRLFPVVLRAAEEGDLVASELLTEAGVKLATLASLVIRRLASPDSESEQRDSKVRRWLPVATTGSVFRQSINVRQTFNDYLKKEFSGIEIRQDLAEPIDGAIARARSLK
jgi:N-acetylglucosamine kinase-like BadF-type ATPase